LWKNTTGLVKKLEINPYLECVFKDARVSACFYHFILIFRLINTKNKMTKTR